MSLLARALGVAAGLLLDRALGEPPDPWHPVSWFGSVMGRVERLGYANSRLAGAGYALVGIGVGAAAGRALQALGGQTARPVRQTARPVRQTARPVRQTARPVGQMARPVRQTARPVGQMARPVVSGGVTVALAVEVAAAGRMLRRTSRDIEELLLAGDLAGARERLPWLVGRDPSGLDESGIAAAVVESLAENTIDAVVAPAFWGLVAGAPGVLVHRAVNTMDAMVGHRSPRYARFGWAAAKVDDAMAFLPARVFALTVAALSLPHARAGHVLRIVRRDAPAHPSPNAGVAESAAAAVLGVQLGGSLRYGERVEDRPTLGDGPRPSARTITQARRLVDRVELTLVVGATALALAAGRRHRLHLPRGRCAC